jgi:hypothetical protein
VLEALGHSFSVQVSLKTPVGTKTPDYVFFSDEPARQAAKRGVLTEADFQGALAVGDAKAWERSLDRAAREVKTLDENPSLQIDTYIPTAAWPGVSSPTVSSGGSITRTHPKNWTSTTRLTCPR